MKTIALLLLAFCLASCGHTSRNRASGSVQNSRVADVVSAKVIGCHDGDTIKVLLQGKPTSIRLEGIDAPELGQPFGRNAREALASLVFGREIVIRKSKAPDRYGRTIGRVFVMPPSGGSLDVNLEMVRQGLAWHYTTNRKEPDLTSAEQSAQAAHSGLWADRWPTSPWVWRKTRS